MFRVFTVYVRPILEYCSAVWNPGYLCEINKIAYVQRQFTKRLKGLRGLSYSAWWSINHANIIRFHHICRHCVPLSSVTTRRHMRSVTQGDLNFPRIKTVTFCSRAFEVSVPKCWNSLPSSLKSSSLQSKLFRRQLKTILMAQPS